MFIFTTHKYISNKDQVEVNDTWSWLFDQSVKHGYDSQPMVPFLYERGKSRLIFYMILQNIITVIGIQLYRFYLGEFLE